MQDLNQLAEEYLQQGKKYYAENQVTEAVGMLLKAKDIATSTNNKVICAEVANVMGVLYVALGSVNIAIDYYLEALRLAEECKHKRVMTLCMNNIGSRYQDLGDYEKAVDYFTKCEAMMKEYGYLDGDKEIPMATVTYLNLIDTCCSLGDYEKAEQYASKAAYYIEADKNHEFGLPFCIIINRMKWQNGNKAYVYDHLPELLQRVYNDVNTANYVQNMTGVCELLEWMEEYEEWERLIKHLQQYISGEESAHLKKFVLEMCLKFYQKTGQNELYRDTCVEYTQISQTSVKEVNLEKIATIDTKIAAFKMMYDHKKEEKKYYLDPLTSMGNRNKLNKDFAVIAQAVSSINAKLALGIIDVDYFKSVNDTYGHLSGDECLCKVAEVLHQAVFEKGEVYRIGGDEFVILIPGVNEEMIMQMAEEIKEHLHTFAIPNKNSEVVPEVTLSQGYICTHVHENMTMKEIFLEADRVLYDAKHAGRNQFLVKNL